MFARFWGRLLAFVIGGILGTVFGVALGFFFFPYVFPPPPAAEQLTQADLMPSPADVVPPREASAPGAIAAAVATGTFIHANPSDPIHHGTGKVSVYENLVHLEADFEVGPGPKFHVYLVPEKNVLPSTNVARTMYVDLGRLRAFKGSQNYPVPAGVDLAKYGSVVIWCEQFGVLISPAALKPST